MAEDDNAEHKIKAGYLYNFIKFVTWPSVKTANFNICIVGHDPFSALIDPIENRTAFGLPIKLLRLDTPPEHRRCHIIFTDAANPNALLDRCIREFSVNSKTLVVGEGDDFAERGGAISFVIRDGKIKLQINLKALQQSGLTISAKLLEVAEIVGADNDD
jgi:hypothetical protein